MTCYHKCIILSSVLFVPDWSTVAMGVPPGQLSSDKVIIERDVQYGDADGRPLKLDIIRPKKPAEGPRPAIVYIHGGGWREKDKSRGIHRLVPYAESGQYVCATIDYRLTGEKIWPAQIHDCKAAVRWLRANARKYNIDPARVGVWGASAGGHLVAMLGTSGGKADLEGRGGSPAQSSRVTCVVDFCGPTDLPAALTSAACPALVKGCIEGLIGGTLDQKAEVARAASPITHVSKDAPPFLIVHGTKDPLVPLDQSESLHKALVQAGVDSTLIKMIGVGHGLAGPELDRRVSAFFAKHLLGRQVSVSGDPIETR